MGTHPVKFPDPPGLQSPKIETKVSKPPQSFTMVFLKVTDTLSESPNLETTPNQKSKNGQNASSDSTLEIAKQSSEMTELKTKSPNRSVSEILLQGKCSKISRESNYSRPWDRPATRKRNRVRNKLVQAKNSPIGRLTCRFASWLGNGASTNHGLFHIPRKPNSGRGQKPGYIGLH